MNAASPPVRSGHVAARAPAAPAFVFADVYREHFGFVWRSARGLGVRPAALDDVVQEIFVIVHRSLPGFGERSSLRTWLSGIVLNVVRHHRRTMRRKSPHEFAGGGAQEDALDPDALCTGERTPYEAAAQAEQARLLQRLLDGIDDDKREVLVLAELEELTVPEIAEALGIKLNTAYSRLRLARLEFEQALARHRAQDGWRHK